MSLIFYCHLLLGPHLIYHQILFILLILCVYSISLSPSIFPPNIISHMNSSHGFLTDFPPSTLTPKESRACFMWLSTWALLFLVYFSSLSYSYPHFSSSSIFPLPHHAIFLNFSLYSNSNSVTHKLCSFVQVN